MARRGGLSSKFYRETRGIKVAGGQVVKSGTVITREGDKWKPGLNVTGRTLLTAACDGQVYFTKKRGNYRRAITVVNVKPVVIKEKKEKTKEKK